MFCGAIDSFVSAAMVPYTFYETIDSFVEDEKVRYISTKPPVVS